MRTPRLGVDPFARPVRVGDAALAVNVALPAAVASSGVLVGWGHHRLRDVSHVGIGVLLLVGAFHVLPAV
jgi:hypothetical protein